MQTEKIKLTNGEITINKVPSTNYVLDGILNKLYVMFELNIKQYKSEEEKERGPLELSLVLDKSGSMKGPKLDNSKIALQQVVDNLSMKDKVHVVVYDRKVQTIIEDGNLKDKKSIKKKIKNIDSGSTTNLSGGLVQGYELLNKIKDRSVNKRVYLFSDGLANEGIVDRAGLEKLARDIHQHGVNVSTFGIGKDFNEDLMVTMAEFGSGDYFYIDKIDSIPRIVGEAIDGLLSVIAHDTIVKIRGVNGATLTKIYTYELQGAKLSDLRDGETRTILAEFEVKPGNLDESGKFFEYELNFRPSDDLLNIQKHSFFGTTKNTSDESLMMMENQEVMDLRARLKISEEEELITKLIDQRRYDEAEKFVDGHIDILKALVDKNSSEENKLSLKLSSDLQKQIKQSALIGDYSMSRKMSSYHSYRTSRSKKRED